MSNRLAAASRHTYDAAVIGAGINGAAAALELAKAGYDVVVLDKGDYGSGTSGRSTRLLHLGLRYFANGSDTPIRSFLRNPQSLMDASKMAKLAMRSREEFVTDRPGRANPLDVYFPLNRDGSYSSYHLDLGFLALRLLGRSNVPIRNRRLSRNDIEDHRLLSALNAQVPLKDVFSFRDYQFDWPERIICDMIAETKAFGGTAFNYAQVRSAEFSAGSWHLSVEDLLSRDPTPHAIKAKSIVNLSGIWLDKVNGAISLNQAPRKITGAKGAHIAIRLPPGYEDFAIMTMSSHDQPIYCIPWKGIHYVGATETFYEGDVDKIVPEEEEVLFLLKEARILFPSLNLTRDDVIYAWAGVRPWTYDEQMLKRYKKEKKLSNPIGSRRREVHDLSEPHAPNVVGLTAGPIMLHRQSGRDVAQKVQGLIGPSPGGERRGGIETPRLADVIFAETGDLREAVRTAVIDEQAVSLMDIMFRRLPFGWREDMGTEVLADIASILAEMNEWGSDRVRSMVSEYYDYLRTQHLFEAKTAKE